MSNPAPGFAKHPGYEVTLSPVGSAVSLQLDGETICTTQGGVWVHESRHEPALYVPLADVDKSRLLSSDTRTYCPFKGFASYHGVRTAIAEHNDVLWEYAEPFDEVAGLVGYAGVYADKVERIIHD